MDSEALIIMFSLGGSVAVGILGVLYGLLLVRRGDPRDDCEVSWSFPLARLARARCGQAMASCCLLVYRVLAFSYALCVLLRDVIVGPSRGPYKLFYYTEWTWSLMTLYLLLAVLSQALHGAQRPRTKSAGVPAEPASAIERAYTSVISALAAILSVNSLFVPICIWLIMFPAGLVEHDFAWMLTFSNLNMHILPPFVVYVDLWASDVPARFGQLGATVVVPALFGFFTVARIALEAPIAACLTQHCGAFAGPGEGLLVWPYPFMDTTAWYAPLCYAALLLTHAVVHAVALRLRTGAAVDRFWRSFSPCLPAPGPKARELSSGSQARQLLGCEACSKPPLAV